MECSSVQNCYCMLTMWSHSECCGLNSSALLDTEDETQHGIRERRHNYIFAYRKLFSRYNTNIVQARNNASYRTLLQNSMILRVEWPQVCQARTFLSFLTNIHSLDIRKTPSCRV
jgi:hypothetical protein